jgi:peptide/nickel transport system ATP-binding protein
VTTSTPTAPTALSPVLEVEDLKTHFTTEEGLIPAVDGVSFSLQRGRTLAIVGESGCGKSVTAYSILRLIQRPGKIVSGKIKLYPEDGTSIDIASLHDKSDLLYHVRGGIASMIFQEPMTALSPVHSVGNQVCEAILTHQKVSKQEAERLAVEMLRRVGIPGPEKRLRQYPFEFSGGMRQRVMIAMALVCRPQLLIADEPTTALDVTIQAQILKLIKDLQQEMNTSVLLITHDLGVVAQMADDVAVMYLGRVVEQADVRSLLRSPRHPYTMGLLDSLPSINAREERLRAIKGTVPSLLSMPPGCPFHPRCPFAQPGRCDVGGPPELRELEDGRKVACVRAEEIIEGSAVPESRQVEAPHQDRKKARRAADPGARDVQPLLQVRDLCKYFPIKSKGFFNRQVGTVKAVDHVSFDLMPGETLGLVGESGSGKTTTARAIMRAFSPTKGKVLFQPNGKAVDLASLTDRELKPLRQQMQMIFQDPYSSLNPRMTVGDIVGEPLMLHKLATGAELKRRVEEALVRVGLKPEHRTRYPHAFSGGQRQRIGIARALIMNPSLIVADEAVSALDVSVQAQVINLLADLQEEFQLTYIFVAHDLSVIRHICDRVAVMYGGKVVELAETESVFENPRHPYTRALISAIPHPDPDRKLAFAVGGEAADPADLPPGCSFHPRCPHAKAGLCDVRGKPPALREITPGRFVSCVRAEEIEADLLHKPGN